MVRADAAVAKPEIYEALESRGVNYSIRIPANENLEWAITEFLPRPVERPSIRPLVEYKSFLCEAASWNKARRVWCQGGASPRRAVPASGLHRHEPEPTGPGGDAVLQQAWDSGAMDQKSQAGGEDDAAVVSSIPGQRSALAVELVGLQPEKSVAAAGPTEKNRPLVTDQLAAAVSEDGRAVGETCPLPLAPVCREPSDAPTVRGDVAADLGAALSSPKKQALTQFADLDISHT